MEIKTIQTKIETAQKKIRNALFEIRTIQKMMAKDVASEREELKKKLAIA